MAQGTPSPPPPPAFIINNIKEQRFSKTVGSEAANKTDNNAWYFYFYFFKFKLTLEIDSYCSILHSAKIL